MFLIHWNAPDQLFESVGSLVASRGVELRLTVVDNGSEPAHREHLVAGLPDGVDVVVSEVNAGFTGAANLAISAFERYAASDEHWLVVAAHDVVVEADTLRQLVAAARAHPGFGVLGPSWWDGTFEQLELIGGQRWGSAESAVSHAGDPEGRDPVETEWVHGALALYRRDCLRDIGGFDERLFSYCEDVDVCRRARVRGWRVGVVPSARATESGYSVGSYWHTYLIHRNNLLLARWHSPPAHRLGVVLGMGYGIARAAVGSLRWDRSPERRAMSRSFAQAQLAALVDGCLGRSGQPGEPFGRHADAGRHARAVLGSRSPH